MEKYLVKPSSGDHNETRDNLMKENDGENTGDGLRDSKDDLEITLDDTFDKKTQPSKKEPPDKTDDEGQDGIRLT